MVVGREVDLKVLLFISLHIIMNVVSIECESLLIPHDSSPDESPKQSSPPPAWPRVDSLSLTASVASLKIILQNCP